MKRSDGLIDLHAQSIATRAFEATPCVGIPLRRSLPVPVKMTTADAEADRISGHPETNRYSCSTSRECGRAVEVAKR